MSSCVRLHCRTWLTTCRILRDEVPVSARSATVSAARRSAGGYRLPLETPPVPILNDGASVSSGLEPDDVVDPVAGAPPPVPSAVLLPVLPVADVPPFDDGPDPGVALD